jgi:hypothetical protein
MEERGTRGFARMDMSYQQFLQSGKESRTSFLNVGIAFLHNQGALDREKLRQSKMKTMMEILGVIS